MKLCVTGHRPKRLFSVDPYSKENTERLRAFSTYALKWFIRKNGPVGVVYTGMALGFDQCIALACIELGVPFIAVVPFPGQEGMWPHYAKAQYIELLSQAMEVKVLKDHMPSVYTLVTQALNERNEWMVSESDQVLTLNSGIGGTANAVEQAIRAGKPVTNVWKQWTEFQGQRKLL